MRFRRGLFLRCAFREFDETSVSQRLSCQIGKRCGWPEEFGTIIATIQSMASMPQARERENVPSPAIGYPPH